MHCFSFDIETVPDLEFGRRMWNLDELSDEDVATAMTFMREQQTGSDFATTINIIYESWIFQIIVVFIVFFHGLNGMGIAILDIWPKFQVFQREALWLQWLIFIPVYGLTVFILVQRAISGSY